MKVFLIDPSLFTQPYDAGLDSGLAAHGAHTTWFTRPLRPGEENLLPATHVSRAFYRLTDDLSAWPRPLRQLAKGLDHMIGWMRVLQAIRREQPDIVHVQWNVLPLIDAFFLALVRRKVPVVLTVHDTAAYNGDSYNPFQAQAYDLPIRMADAVIVHTQSAQARLLARGIAAEKLHIIPHGPLHPENLPQPLPDPDGRFRFLFFGQIKPYKGLDLLVEAVVRMAPEIRARCRFIIAGTPKMPMETILARISECEISDAFDLRLRRQSESEVEILLSNADAFLFPYREIDASGVFYLVRGLKKWIIAFSVGVFKEELSHLVDGMLLPPGDIDALGHAISLISYGQAPSISSHNGVDWRDIGARSITTYRAVLSSAAAGRHRSALSPQAA